jgi:hypothetical protein
MRKKMWLSAAVLLVFCGAATAAEVDCTNATITCNQLTKGSSKFKPVLATHPVGTCPTSLDGKELISIKGTLADCTVTGAGAVKVISGSVKGTLYTGDCSCAGLAVSPNPLVAPPVGKFNQLTTSWKFDTTAADVCTAGQKSSVLTLFAANGAGITAGPFIAGLANAQFTGVYGGFTLKDLAVAPGPDVAVTGIFQGADNGATSHTSGSTVESLGGLFGTCGGAKGLKAITFGATDSTLQ